MISARLEAEKEIVRTFDGEYVALDLRCIAAVVAADSLPR